MNRTADFSSFTQRSLAFASLDIGRVLADRDSVTFRSQGTCMHPTVRPGDVLRIQSREVAQVNVGDLAVCRGDGFLFSHRVIAKGERDGRSFIATRPDRTHEGSDAPTFDDDLLGVVVAITRNGKPVSLVPTPYPWLLRRCYLVSLALIEAASQTKLRLVNRVERMQNRSLYRNIARAWFALMRPSVSYAVRLPLNAKLGNAVYRQLAPDKFDARGTWAGRAVERWTLVLHLNDGRKPASRECCMEKFQSLIMKTYKSALPGAILGLALLFPACATSSGVDQLRTLPQKEVSAGLVPKEYLCPGTGQSAPDPRLPKEIAVFLEKNEMFRGVPEVVAFDLPIILNVPIQQYLHAFAKSKDFQPLGSTVNQKAFEEK